MHRTLKSLPFLLILCILFLLSGCASLQTSSSNGRIYGEAMAKAKDGAVQQNIPPENMGPPSFYPDNEDHRIYKLPYTAGKAFECMDGYFSDPMGHPVWSDHPDYSLDFRMPEGEPILAARGGVVLKIVNPTKPGEEGESNRLYIGRIDTLADGRSAWTKETYEHIRNDVPVKVGDTVKQGQLIAFNSNSGCFHMHLHFEVNMENQQGHSLKELGGDGRTITSIPTPFLEIRRKGGYPVLGEYWISKNEP
ncbi:MAG: M23 family metallopeptidase [Fibrobacteres bacterium]|nr:M23 family metallopeptidase [Fibrobacterota bacterium]